MKDIIICAIVSWAILWLMITGLLTTIIRYLQWVNGMEFIWGILFYFSGFALGSLILDHYLTK